MARVALIVVAMVAVGFFLYNALLWQSDESKIQPPADNGLRREMASYAAGDDQWDGKGGSLGESAPDIPLAMSDSFAWEHYTVKKGDTISKIAEAHSLSLDAVIASNNLKNARAIQAGDTLKLPNMDGIPYTAVDGDTYEKIANKFDVPVNAILDANDISSGDLEAGASLFIPGARMKSDDLRKALGEAFIYPVRGRISSQFGWRKDPFTGQRRFHNALDIAAPAGTPIKCTRDGKVTVVGYSRMFGKYIIVAHPDGYQSLYAHMSVTSAERGERVRQGDVLGKVGTTGHTTGPHVHFAIYKNTRPVNPLDLLSL
jgi:murein DD-endopeptidase MepM/ murein hydrolase activator NlpD